MIWGKFINTFMKWCNESLINFNHVISKLIIKIIIKYIIIKAKKQVSHKTEEAFITQIK